MEIFPRVHPPTKQQLTTLPIVELPDDAPFELCSVQILSDTSEIRMGRLDVRRESMIDGKRKSVTLLQWNLNPLLTFNWRPGTDQGLIFTNEQSLHFILDIDATVRMDGTRGRKTWCVHWHSGTHGNRYLGVKPPITFTRVHSKV